jgi:hypothetical protein
MSVTRIFQPNDAAAGGWGALHAVAEALLEESALVEGAKSLLSMKPVRRVRLPRLRLARSEAHQLVRVLRERRQGCRLGDDQAA